MRTCAHCDASIPVSGRKYCDMRCRRQAEALRRESREPGWLKAKERAKNHRRRVRRRQVIDVTADYERLLRAKARRCPLCAINLTNDPYLPSSKELDHIIPINVGGTHSIGNVRIICRDCNLRRPKDGCDYVGPVTLWAEEPGFIMPKRNTCGCGTRKRAGRCWTCRPSKVTPRAEDGRLAAKLRATGHKWQDIADRLGFGNPGATYLAAQRYGDPLDIARWPKRYQRNAA